jgi:hypothetical protein
MLMTLKFRDKADRPKEPIRGKGAKGDASYYSRVEPECRNYFGSEFSTSYFKTQQSLAGQLKWRQAQRPSSINSFTFRSTRSVWLDYIRARIGGRFRTFAATSASNINARATPCLYQRESVWTVKLEKHPVEILILRGLPRGNLNRFLFMSWCLVLLGNIFFPVAQFESFIYRILWYLILLLHLLLSCSLLAI